jgi:hypothetical protein
VATAAAYLRDTSAAMAESYTGDCLVHACRLAELLLGERRAPWIGRVRDVRGDFHGPLVPRRYLGRGGPTWTTHYVACAGRLAFDPLLGEPIDLDHYATAVFGRHLEVQTHLDETETARWVLAQSTVR